MFVLVATYGLRASEVRALDLDDVAWRSRQIRVPRPKVGTPLLLSHPGVVPPTTERANDLWTADFKDHFRTRDGIYCYPLTVADQHTRYLLGCQGLLSTQGQGVRPIFERLFREYGLPRVIRTDNGVPFATTGIHGIQHQRILPASPQQNGAHERMHRTLKAATARPPQGAPDRPATRLQPVPRPLQRRAPAPISRGPDARLAVSPLAPALHRSLAADRVPRPLHSQAGDKRGDDPAQAAPADYVIRA